MTAATGSAHEWDEFYKDPAPPWDIGRPQPAFLRVADTGALTGALLDAGCGSGEHTMLAASHGAVALGIDVSPRAIEIAQRKATERGVETMFQVFDALTARLVWRILRHDPRQRAVSRLRRRRPHSVHHGPPCRSPSRRSPSPHVL